MAEAPGEQKSREDRPRGEGGRGGPREGGAARIVDRRAIAGKAARAARVREAIAVTAAIVDASRDRLRSTSISS